MSSNDRCVLEPGRWVRISDAAEAACVTPRTMRRWIATGFVRASKPAFGRVLVDLDSLASLIEQGVTNQARR